MDTKVQKSVYVSGYQPADNGYINFAGLTAEEVERMQGVEAGHWWATVKGGRFEFSPVHEPLPKPTDDAMLPQWRTPVQEEGGVHYQPELFEPETEWRRSSPSILIQDPCGYNYTPELYRSTVELLEGCGFACMRSQRGDNGRFWEIWFLPGLWAAKGRLKEALYGKSEAHEMRFALKFLREHASFGTLDLSVQRLCQILD